MTDNDLNPSGGAGADPLVKGAAVGAATVLLVFLLIVGVLYFSSDYQFARAAVPGAEPGDGGGPAVPSIDGAAVAAQTGCVACHSIDGSIIVGPSWLGLFGSEPEFEDGTTAVADAAYIRNSILNPNDQVVAGFTANLMPQVYGDLLSPAEIDALVAYISSLG